MSARQAPPAPRRLEVPVLSDVRGNVWAAGVLDATLRHQDRRVLAESPPPGLAPEQVRAILGSGAEMARARGDAGAVTVVFSAEPASGEMRLLETLPGLPPEHAVLEALTGVDLLAWQSRLARGGSLDSDLPEPRGHAFQVCLSARDPEDGFAPAPGVVETLRLPSGAGLRADPLLEEGEAPDSSDPAIVRLTAHGRSRTEALLRLQQGLAKTVAVVSGGGTDKAFLAELLDQSEIDRGGADPVWLERLIASGAHLSRRGADAALLAAAIAVYERETEAAQARYYASAVRGRPEVPPAIGGMGASAELWYRGQGYALRVACLEPGLYRIDVDGSCLEIKAKPPARTGRRLACGGRGWHVSVVPQEDDFLIEVDGVPHRISGDQGSVVRAPAPAVVVAVPVREGEEVQAGDPLVVLEAMKMETTVPAPAAGRVRKVLVRKNSQVGTAGPMLVLDPPSFGDRRARPEAGARVRFGPLLRRKASSCRESLLEVRRLVLGYDVEPDAAQRAAEAVVDTDEAGADRLIQDILRTYVDLGSLFRRQADDGIRHSAEEYLFTFLRDLDAHGEALPPSFLARLRRALEHYGVASLERSPELEESLFRIGIAHWRQPRHAAPVLALLERLLSRLPEEGSSQGDELRDVLDRLVEESQGREPAVHDLAREVRYRLFDRPILLAARDRLLAAAESDLASLTGPLSAEERAGRIRAVVECPQPLHALLSERFAAASPRLRAAILEILVQRYYSRVRNLHDLSVSDDDLPWLRVDYEHPRADVRLLGFHTSRFGIAEALDMAARQARTTPRDGRELALDFYLYRPGDLDEEALAAEIAAALARPDFPQDLRRIAVCIARPEGVRCFTFRQGPEGGYEEDGLTRGLHPMIAQRFELWRLTGFRLHRLPAPDGVLLFHGTAHENPRDERLFALAEVRDLTPVRDAAGRIVELPQLERMLMEALAGIRRFQSRRAPGERLHWNRVLLYLWPPVDLRPDEINGLVRRLTPRTEGLGLEKVALRCRIPDRDTGNLRDWVLEISNPGTGMVLRFRRPSEAPLKPLREYSQRIIELRKRGLFDPFDVIRMLAPPRQTPQGAQAGDLPPGDFTEHDLDSGGRLVPVDRPPGSNRANLVAGVVRSYTERYPEGMARVLLLGDAGRGMGTLAEPECRLILGALDLAERMQVPLEWFALSGGARIAMDSGTENMDWIGLVLRRLVEHTQRGGEVNVVVPGINVGAQPYWNAEATMLMHTRGILIMTPEGAMVLTGKQALDYSGGVSAEDNQGIGGYERIMGPNGQAQYFAHDVPEACRILLRWYEHTWKAPGERFPRPAPTRDARDRDVQDYPHGGPHGGNFRTVGEVFSEETNPGRKKPFDIRKVMGAVIDQDHAPLERWYGMHDAEIGVVWDAHLGGHPVCLLGFESRPLSRLGFVPADGPDHWTGGTLFPLSSKKIARAINSASHNRPLVVLANLSGFDGSPESMRQWQLEYGAEIGRAVVNFQGPIVFCVVSRYHGGAFVVFSNALNDNMEMAALEGAHASVIGGAPAAAVVFAREVDKRTRRDPRIAELEQEILDSTRTDKAALRARLGELLEVVRSEKLGELADEFDHIHSIQRAEKVGSIHHILPPARLRPYLIEAVERGMEKELAGHPSPALADVPST
ncbi:MAG TPA: carboxyl transferase domain-containing protein [Thermoanaerobaculia bacterium]|jgi:acetyl-CoA carboxylase carboxyltransferase component/biotin carboxyl carrier protein|nr:carboxyl transferase domain-containing protein [Thermoanaerobaculia bacterium]